MAPLHIVREIKSEDDIGEDLRAMFAEQYGAFLKLALQVTDFDRAAAEELVHDAYVDLATSATNVDGISNLNGYLYRVLRNLNCSRMRRAWKHEHDDLEILDYDSLYLRLRVRTTTDRIELQDQLAKLCGFLCWRKESSRTASLLLLRFFWGFQPQEIMLLARLPRPSVDNQIWIARNEARSYLKNPEKFPMAHKSLPANKQEVPSAIQTDNFLAKLRAMIGAARTGSCLTDERSLDEAHDGPLTIAELAHLASCASCLDSVARQSNLAPPEERWPLDPPTSDHARARRNLKLADQTIREILCHKPQALTLAVNGEDAVRWEIGARDLGQHFTVPTSTPVEFVEVFSNQGLRLLRCDILDSPPSGPPEAKKVVTLADGRTLSVTCEWYGHCPRIRVEYAAPSDLQTLVELPYSRPLVSAQPVQSIGSTSLQEFGSSSARRWKLFEEWIARYRWPLIGAFVALTLTGTIVHYTKVATPMQPSAVAVLHQSIQAETATLSPSTVSHQILAFHLQIGSGATLETGRVEVWKTERRIAKRLFAADGHLVGGQWQDENGRVLSLQHGRLEGASPERPAEVTGMSWASDLSAESFERLNDGDGRWSVSETPSDDLVELRPTPNHNAPASEPRLIRAVLRIDRNSHRAKEEHVWITQKGDVYEYSYVEVSYDPRTSASPDAEVLRPDRNLTQPHDRHPRPAPTVSGGATESLLHLQLDVWMRLHSVGADVGTPIDLLRTADGKLLLRGTVGSDEREQEVRNALAPLTQNQQLELRLKSATRTRPDRRSSSKMAVSTYEIDASTLPAEEMLNRHFRELGYSKDQLDQAIRDYCQNVLRLSTKSLQESWALHQFSHSFTAEELKRLDLRDQQRWFILLQTYTTDLGHNLQALQGETGWLTASPPSPKDSSPFPLSENPAPVASVDEIQRRLSEVGRELTLLLTASADMQDQASLPAHIHELAASLSAADLELSRVENVSDRYSALLHLH